MAGKVRQRRSSMAARLLFGCLLITVVLIASVSGFLLISRSQQTAKAVRTEATNRAATAYQLLVHVTEPQTQFAATALASEAALQAALSGSSPGDAVAALFGSGVASALPGTRAVVVDASGNVLYTGECGNSVATADCESQSGAHLTAATPTVAAALAEGARAECQVSDSAISADSLLASKCPQGYEGVEVIQGSLPAFDAAVAVKDSNHHLLGVAVYSATLQAQFRRLGAAILYIPLFLANDAQHHLFRFDPSGASYTMTTTTAPSALASMASTTPATLDASYTTRGAGDVAGSFTAVTDANGRPAGYLGVEVPQSVFAGQTASDEWTIVLIGITAMVVVFALVATFMTRSVLWPVGRLERGVRRIANGDYSSDIPVTRNDELGRLAGSVNVMRGQIAGYIGHLDASLARLESVSRALTTTTSGVENLQRSVLVAAAAIGGKQPTTALFAVTDGKLELTTAHGEETAADLDGDIVAQLLIGENVRRQRQAGDRNLLAVPMFYQQEVRGALAVWTGGELSDSDEKAMAALANNGAVAMENTRLFEQERETVKRLRELDSLKSNFLTTTQHELRTPVLAIRGELELMTAAWQHLDDDAKMELVHDMEISTRLLGEIVENIVVFSLLNSESITLRRKPVDVRAAVHAAVGAVRANVKGEFPVTMNAEIEPGLHVDADRDRFEHVLRALLDNAVKFTPAGGTVAVRGTAHELTCRIEVADSGIGMAEDELAGIFDHLSQVDGSRTRRYGGMGMGLALVQRLSEAHGATVEVTSQAERGTCFTLHWPRAIEQTVESTPADAPQERTFTVVQTADTAPAIELVASAPAVAEAASVRRSNRSGATEPARGRRGGRRQRKTAPGARRPSGVSRDEPDSPARRAGLESGPSQPLRTPKDESVAS